MILDLYLLQGSYFGRGHICISAVTWHRVERDGSSIFFICYSRPSFGGGRGLFVTTFSLVLLHFSTHAEAERSSFRVHSPRAATLLLQFNC